MHIVNYPYSAPTNYSGAIKSQCCHELDHCYLYVIASCQTISLTCFINYFGGEPRASQAVVQCQKNSSHLDLWNNGAPLRAGASKGSEWSWGHQRTRPAKAAEITAGNIIFLMPHDNGIHDKKPSPWQPESMLLGDEWRPLKVQGHCYAPIGHQVEAGRQTCRMQ